MQATDSSNSSKPAILKNTRESKGLTLEIVHEATKIPLDALKAIEEGYSVRLVSPFYFRGFIKIYSEFLGLNVPDVFKQYGLDQPLKTSAAGSATPVKPAPQPAGPNMFLEQLQEWGAFMAKPKNIKLGLKVLGAAALVFVLFKIGGCMVSHLHSAKPLSRKQPVYFTPAKKSVDVQEDEDFSEPLKRAPAPAALQHEAAPVQAEAQKVEVAVRAVRNTWLQVKADGKVVFQMTLSKGSMESWSADDNIELSGKNIERLDMEVNGKHIGPLGGGQRRVRRVLITKEGLTVKK